MNFEKNHIYHIYNQGNNRQDLFFSEANYLFFLRKIRYHILPFSDILAWCLMPNHFHLMVFVRQLRSFVGRENVTCYKEMDFSKSLGIMLSSYTRAVNIETKQSGSLFRKQTKAVCLTAFPQLTRSWFMSNGITEINILKEEKNYPNICFNYIMNNPVKSGIVAKAEDWPFSSHPDYIGQRNGDLINRDRIAEFGLGVIST